MKKIISSQLYQLRCKLSLLRITLLMTVGIAAMGLLVTATSEGEKSAGALFLEGNGLSWIFQIMLIGIMCGMICAGDFGEKDLNYELMNGHSRLSSYAARVFICVAFTSVVATLLAFAPYIVTALVYGWGDRIKATDICIRTALFFFPFMRMASLFSMLAFIVKKQSVVITLGFLSEMGCIILNHVILNKVGYMLGIFNLTELMNVGDFSLYTVVPGRGVVQYTVCEGAPDPGLAIGTVIVSLVMSAVYLVAGYAFFRRDDLD